MSAVVQLRQGPADTRVSTYTETGAVTDGELNEDERKAIAGLSGAFQDALDGLAEEPPRWSLARLANASSPLLSSVSLRETRQAEGAVVQTIDFEADSTQRPSASICSNSTVPSAGERVMRR